MYEVKKKCKDLNPITPPLDTCPLPLQHCAGASFVEKFVESLAPTGNTVVVDMFGYDAWPASHCLQRVVQGPMPSVSNSSALKNLSTKGQTII